MLVLYRFFYSLLPTAWLLRRYCLWLALFGLGMPNAYAQCVREYRVALSPAGYLVYRNEQGKLAGIMVDLLQALQQRSGCKLVWDELPMGRALKLAAEGQFVMRAPVGPPLAESLNVSFVPLFATPTELIVRRDQLVDSVPAAKARMDMRFGMIDTSDYGNWGNDFFASLPPARLDISNDVAEVFHKLQTGRIGATLEFAVIYQPFLDKYKLHKLVRIVPTEAPRAIGGLDMNTKYMEPKDQRYLQSTLQMLRNEGSLGRIMAPYLGVQSATDLVWQAKRDLPH